MKNQSIFLLTFLLAAVLITACSSHGKEKDFKGVQLFYTDAITEAEADSLGSFLEFSGFADGTEKTVQITREGDLYQFRMVVVDDYDAEEGYEAMFRIFARDLSENVFRGKKVELHACDDKLKTIEVFEMAENMGDFVEGNGVKMFYTNTVSVDEVNKLLEFFEYSGFSDGSPKTGQLIKEDDVYIVKVVVDIEKIDNPDMEAAFIAYAGEISEAVFENSMVEIHACNAEFTTQKVFAMAIDEAGEE
ncbi:MAG: hypothetical protein KA793_01380 [Bacteroidales bacterium]|nr:hypothetical protein [Bacteroidales bacterium]